MGELSRRVSTNLQDAFPGIRFLGGACWLAWILLIYSSELFDHGGDIHFYNAMCYFVSTLSIGGVYLAAGFRPDVLYGFMGKAAHVVAAGLVAALGTLLVVWGSYQDGALCAVGALGDLMTGMGTGFVSLRCALSLGDLSARRAGAVCFGAGALGMLIYSAAVSFPYPAMVGFTALLPPVAGALSTVEDTQDGTARSNGYGRLGPGFWRFVAVVFLLSFSLTISRGLYPNALQIGQFDESRGMVALISLGFCLLMTVLTCALPKKVGFDQLAYWMLFLTAAVFLAFPVAGMFDPGVGVAFSTAFILLGVVSWAVLGGVASITGLPTLQVYGFGFCTYLFGSAIGWPFGQVLSAGGLFVESRYFEVTLVMLVLVGFVAILRRSDFADLLRSNDEAAPAEASPSEVSQAEEQPRKMRWRVAVSILSEEGRLTPRETSVLELLAKTGDAHYIANTLGISYNTARTHVRNIYAKLDVHSHAELMERVESVRGQGAVESPCSADCP